jgi:carbonic anhydrase
MESKMQMKYFAGILLVSASLLASADETAPHWAYTGEHGVKAWGDMPGDGTCKLGHEQSPIDIRDAKKGKLAPLDLGYKKGSADIVNNGHTIQVTPADGGGLNIDGVPYKLVQFHFHTPSEEKIHGKAYSMVMHLVHQNADGKLAVIAVLLTEGKANAALAPVFDNMPAKEGDKKSLPAALDVTDFLPADKGYYTFNGSLTTPPCSEGVRWFVLKHPVEISKAQHATFQKLYKMNARPVQPLNGRVVEQD